MTRERDFDRLARAWLELGPDEAPDRVVAAVLQAAETMPQVRRRTRWPVWRLIPMNRLPVAAGAAAILVVAVGGAILLRPGSPSGVGGPPPASPTAVPTASPTPAPTPVPLSNLDVARVLSPGTYRVGAPFGAPFGFTNVSPWTIDNFVAGEYTMSDVSGNGSLVVDVIDNVFGDPCQDAAPLASPVPRTLDGIVAALGAMKDFTVSSIADVTIGGHPGKEFDLANTVSDPAACANGSLIPIWSYQGGGKSSTNPGATEHLIVLDVAGTPVGLSWGAGATPTDAFRQEVETMVRTLDFQ